MQPASRSADKPLRVLIVDDERLARERIEELVSRIGGAEIVGSAENGDQAVSAIRTLRPDLVFLDVQMPGRTGLDVVREIGPNAMPATIFVTAYDQYALNAFEIAAVDYLVKPFDDDRFEQAFERARRRVNLADVERLSDELLALLQTRRPEAPAEARGPAPQLRYLERIAVETRGQVRVVPVDQIQYITASGPYAELHVGDRTYIIRERMQDLDERLDPERFFRVHRSTIVRLDLIEALLRGQGGDYAVRLKNGTRLKVSRSRFDELEKRIGIAS